MSSLWLRELHRPLQCLHARIFLLSRVVVPVVTGRAEGRLHYIHCILLRSPLFSLLSGVICPVTPVYSLSFSPPLPPSLLSALCHLTSYLFQATLSRHLGRALPSLPPSLTPMSSSFLPAALPPILFHSLYSSMSRGAVPPAAAVLSIFPHLPPQAPSHLPQGQGRLFCMPLPPLPCCCACLA